MLRQSKLGIIFGILLMGFWLMPVSYGDNSSQELSQLEQQLFAQTYPSESPEDRVTRIETTVFGQSHANQPLDQRLQALGQFVEAPSPQQQRPQPVAHIPPPVSPSETSYPIVVAMEKQVFHQTYETEPLETRLARLEQKVFGHPMQGSLADRSDHLEDVVLGHNPQDAYSQSGENNDIAYSPAASSPQNSADAHNDVQQALPNIENKVFHQTYPQDTVENRLSRLEQKLFNATAPEMSPEDRLYRIAGVLSAQKSSREDTFANVNPNNTGYGYPGGTTSTYTQAPSPVASYGMLGVTLLMMLMSFL